MKSREATEEETERASVIHLLKTLWLKSGVCPATVMTTREVLKVVEVLGFDVTEEQLFEAADGMPNRPAQFIVTEVDGTKVDERRWSASQVLSVIGRLPVEAYKP